jgi:hypothetical protein
MEGIDYSQILKPHYRVGYKFLSVDGALNTLENQTLRFSFASTFNDPFDCNEQMLYISDLRMFIKKFIMDNKYGENLNSDEYEMKFQEELKIFNSKPDSLEGIGSSLKKNLNFPVFQNTMIDLKVAYYGAIMHKSMKEYAFVSNLVIH